MTTRALASVVVFVAGALGAGAIALGAVGCGDACRTITVKDLGLQCSTTSTFTGEIHFDDPATYESFLLTDCLPDADDATRAQFVNAVDFTKNAVFVAVGLRLDTGGARCIETRKDDDVQVCDNGLRVDFADTISDATGNGQCGGKWTVAFSLPRADLRAALQSAAAQQPAGPQQQLGAPGAGAGGVQ